MAYALQIPVFAPNGTIRLSEPPAGNRAPPGPTPAGLAIREPFLPMVHGQSPAATAIPADYS